MSSIVAVAGGSGGLGKPIVDAIVALGSYQVFIISRAKDGTSGSVTKDEETGVSTITVDYEDVGNIQKALEDNSIDTAADQAKPTRRLVVSTWGGVYNDEVTKTIPFSALKQQILTAVRSTTTLEYTSWVNGYFADYFLGPGVPSTMTPFPLIVDAAHNFAAIPGSGDVPISFTHTADVAKFVAASLALPAWRQETYLIGDRLTLNELVALEEAVKGVKFEVVYDPVEMLERGLVTELPSHKNMYAFLPKEMLQGFAAGFGRLFESGLLELKVEHTIQRDLPELKARTMRELLVESWRGE